MVCVKNIYMFEISTEGFKLIINNGNHRFKFAKYI